MRLFIKLAVVVAALGFVSSPHPAQALETQHHPDNEQIRLSRELPATLVIRVNHRNHQVEVLNSYAKLDTSATTRNAVVNHSFKAVNVKGKTRGHAHHVGGGRGLFDWFLGFSFFSWNNPYYVYGGYSYPYNYYYSYPYGDYDYYYYNYPSSPWWW